MNNKVGKVKKPFYKRIWFWVLAVIVVIAVGGTVGGKGNNSSSNGGNKVAKKASNQSSKSQSPKMYKVGDTVKVGKVVYTLKSVEKTSERNEFEDSKPQNVIKVVYHVKNEGKDDLPIGTDLEAYGPDNNKLKAYAINDNTLDSVAAGKEADVTTGFGLNKLGKIELQFKPLASFDKAAKFSVIVQ